jgi:hypothetical protein
MRLPGRWLDSRWKPTLSENAPHGRKPAGQKRRRGRLSSRDKPVKHGKRRCKRRHRIESMFGRPED